MKICDECGKQISKGIQVHDSIESEWPDLNPTSREDFCSWICLWRSLDDAAKSYGWKQKIEID